MNDSDFLKDFIIKFSHFEENNKKQLDTINENIAKLRRQIKEMDKPKPAKILSTVAPLYIVAKDFEEYLIGPDLDLKS